jgi:NAD(P)-dependent dehydrogenase (short-subunit alcohol dehydrogenase family)
MAVSFDLTSQRILVIGASSGVGRAVGNLASRSGAHVAFAARRVDRLEVAAAEAPGEAIAVPCDVQSAADCARAVSQTVAAFGGLDGLVYAAGMSPLAMLEEATQEEWRRVLDTNLVGASLITAAALPHLKESAGRALFVSSYAVRQSLPGLALYRTSKVALDALIEGWRMEHPDVEFARVMLGNTEGTEFADAWDPQRLAAAMKVWLERGLFPSATMMPLAVAAEALVSVLAIRGYADDTAIMPRARDQAAEQVAEEKAEARDAEERRS